MTARKVPALDGFRLVAAVLVVMIHTSPLASISPTVDFWLTRVLARLAVPFFLMASGYFLAAKDGPELRKFWKRTASVYVVAAALYLPLNLYAGMSPVEWVRGFLWEGTFYHLWYFPALLWGSLVARQLWRLGARPALAIAGVLYLIGLDGDSYFNWAERVPLLRQVYGAIFAVTEYTRNGLFYAPLFLILGAALSKRSWRLSTGEALLGFALSFIAMTAEGLWLHGLGAQHHDSMYLTLPVCMVFLFCLLLRCNDGRWKAARELSLLVYLLHPACIVVVRGLARYTGTWSLLVENRLGHFAAVLAMSFALAAALRRLRPLALPPDARAWRELDADALRNNVRALQEAVGPGCQLMAVLKADAYGHGAKQFAHILQREGIRAYAVACLAEGIALRKAGIRGTILILGWTPPEQAPLLARWRLTQTVASLEHGRALASQRCRVRVHLALDTGMHRLGIDAEDRTALRELFALPKLRVEGVFSHLCVSDDLTEEQVAFTRRQAEKFRTAVHKLRADGCAPGKVHLLASYGIWNYPEYGFDFARAGIALYGVHSDGGSTRRELPLQPVLALKARVARVRRLAPGETAGYGRDFVADEERVLAVVTIGYADGLPRSLSDHGGRVLLRGVSCRMVGRMCMDQLLVDVTDVPEVSAGDVATLIGQDGNERIPVEELARCCGTISNEILSRLGSRLPLRFLQ